MKHLRTRFSSDLCRLLDVVLEKEPAFKCLRQQKYLQTEGDDVLEQLRQVSTWVPLEKDPGPGHWSEQDCVRGCCLDSGLLSIRWLRAAPGRPGPPRTAELHCELPDASFP